MALDPSITRLAKKALRYCNHPASRCRVWLPHICMERFRVLISVESRACLGVCVSLQRQLGATRFCHSRSVESPFHCNGRRPPPRQGASVRQQGIIP